MEVEMLKEYGGIRENNMQAFTCYILSLVDNREIVFNFLVDFFSIWKNSGGHESKKRKLLEFVQKKSK